MQRKTRELLRVLTERKRKKVKKVAKALSKASKLHAGQAKTLRGVIGAKKKKRQKT